MQRNARFWVYVNCGLVKVTLTPGQRLSWGQWAPTDEGWNASYETWEHHGDSVRNAYGNDGHDCDGRLSTGGESCCALEDLASGNEPYGLDGCDNVRFPAWRDTDSWQRDYAAEAAGY